MNRLKQLLLTGVFFYLPFSGMAWGVLGHRIVGEIAESYLTPKAREAVKQILGNETMAMASNWADFIRSDSSYSYLTQRHFINLPDSLNKEQLKRYLMQDTAKDVYTELNFLIKDLKNKKLDPDEKLMDLRLLIHLVGDVHQPMHVSREEDWGGNKIKVKWFRDQTNLHAVWDDKLINFQQLSYTEYAKAINFTTIQQRKLWQAAPIYEWVYESHEIALSLYNEITEDDQKLGYRYNFDHIATLNDRLLKAGVRLAGLLNQIFDA